MIASRHDKNAPFKLIERGQKGIMKNLIIRFARDESASAAIEYGLIAAGISVAIIAVVQGIGRKLSTTMEVTQSLLN